MADPLPTRAESPRESRGAVWRVLFNAALLTFASLLVISVVAGRAGASLLWAGALLVFLAPALDRLAKDRTIGIDALARHADRLRWAGLALAAAGAAVVLV